MRKTQLKWLYAQLFLAWIGFIHYAKKFWPWTVKVPGIDQFKRNYFGEKHLPCSANLRAIAHEPGRCITCGLCDLACPEALSPMRVLLNPNRAQTDFKSCVSCKACETACPQNIPIITYVQLASKTFHPGPPWRQKFST